jgi:hypothetical protein
MDDDGGLRLGADGYKVCIHLYIYVYIYVYMCINVYIHVCIYTSI